MRLEVNTVKQNISKKTIISWAYPIALRLHNCNCSLVIKWAAQCLQMYLSEFKCEKFAQLNKYIQDVLDSETGLTSVECYELSKEIWYLPDRDEVQTAIARLWWSIGAFKDGEELDGIREAAMAVELVLPDISNHHLLERYLEVAINIFEEYQRHKSPDSKCCSVDYNLGR